MEKNINESNERLTKYDLTPWESYLNETIG